MKHTRGRGKKAVVFSPKNKLETRYGQEAGRSGRVLHETESVTDGENAHENGFCSGYTVCKQSRTYCINTFALAPVCDRLGLFAESLTIFGTV